jgi:hypothetical protein
VELSLEKLQGLRADIETHPSLRNITYGHYIRVGILLELVGDNDIDGEKEFDSLSLGLLDELTGDGDEILFNHGLADLEALGTVEGEDHSTADEDLVALLDERFDDGDLGRDLGTTDDGSEGPNRGVNGTLEELKLLLKKEAGDLVLDELGHTFSRCVGTVSRAKGIVDIDGGILGELLGELGIVLLLLMFVFSS